MFNLPTKDEVKDFIDRNKTEIAATAGCIAGYAIAGTICVSFAHQFDRTHYHVPKKDWDIAIPKTLGNEAANSALYKDGIVSLFDGDRLVHLVTDDRLTDLTNKK